MMYQTLELQDGDEDSDRLTNPDLFSNPDSNDDGFVAVDEQLPLSDVWSDSSSCGNFHLSPLSHLDVDKQESENLSLKSFHMCLGSTGPDMLEQVRILSWEKQLSSRFTLLACWCVFVFCENLSCHVFPCVVH